MASTAPSVYVPPMAPGRLMAMPVQHLLLLLSLLYATLTQLDAVGNRLTAGLPISAGEILFAGLVAVSLIWLLTIRLNIANDGKQMLPLGVRLILILCAWIILCWVMSAHKSEGVDYLIKLSGSILPALCIMLAISSPRQLTLVTTSILLAGMVAAAIVLIEYKTGTRLVATSIAATTAEFEGAARSSGGSDANPTTAAQMLMVSAVLAMVLTVYAARRWKPLLLGATALSIAALGLMSARSALIGLALAAGLLGWRFRGHRAFPLIILAGVAAVIGLIAIAPPELVERFMAIGDFAKDRTLFRRITYLRIGGDLLSGSPVWGIGPGNFPTYYLSPEFRWYPGRILEPRELHNMFLDTAVEYGLVGLALFLLLLREVFAQLLHATRSASRELSTIAIALMLALAALLAASFFMPHKDLRYLWLLIALGLRAGMLAAARNPDRKSL
jgi:O-antigen ligase